MTAPLAFFAGAVAEQRGWTSTATVVTADELPAQTPDGNPLIVAAATNTLTVDTMRRLAALHGAGRPVALVCDSPPSEALSAWLPTSLIHPASSLPDHPTPAEQFIFGGGEFEDFVQGMLEGELAEATGALADLLDGTRIEVNLDVDWWMPVWVRVHQGSQGHYEWGDTDPLSRVRGVVAAVPFILDGQARALGVVGIGEQDEGCFLITAERKLEPAQPYGSSDYKGAYSDERFPGYVAYGLLGREDPSSYPLSIAQDATAREFFDEFFRTLLFVVLKGVLAQGSDGLVRFIPHMNDWVRRCQTYVAETLRAGSVAESHRLGVPHPSTLP